MIEASGSPEQSPSYREFSALRPYLLACSRLLIPSACEMSTRTVYPPLHLYLYIWRLPPNVYGETGGTRPVVLVISSKAATSNGTSPMAQLLILMPINSRLSCLRKTNGFIDILSLINSGPGKGS